MSGALEVAGALDLLDSMDAGADASLVAIKVKLLRRQGKTSEALELIDRMPMETPVELKADLLHLAGRYEEAHRMLLNAIEAGQFDERTTWLLRLRAAHHLKFIEPLAAADELRCQLADGQPPDGTRSLTAYTYWGSVRAFTHADISMRDGLIETMELARGESDQQTIAKAARKLGEYYEFIEHDPLRAEDTWLTGTQVVAGSHSRQLEYLATVSFWIGVREGQAMKEVRDFYAGRRSQFARLGMRGWEGHCELLVAEAMRLSGQTETAISFFERANRCIWRFIRFGVFWRAILAGLWQSGMDLRWPESVRAPQASSL